MNASGWQPQIAAKYDVSRALAGTESMAIEARPIQTLPAPKAA